MGKHAAHLPAAAPLTVNRGNMALQHPNSFVSGSGGRSGGEGVAVEDELVGAAIQISELRQEVKQFNRALQSKTIECSRQVQQTIKNSLRSGLTVKSRRVTELEAALSSAEARDVMVVEPPTDRSEEVDRLKARIAQLERDADERAEKLTAFDAEREELKQSEKEAVATAQQAYDELAKRNKEMEQLRAQLRQQSPGSKPEAPVSGVGGSHGESAGSVPGEVGMGGRSRYAMDDDDAAAEAEGVEGGRGSGGQEDARKGRDQEEEDDGEENDDDDDDDDDDDQEEEDNGRRRSGLFGWITGISRKRRRAG